MIEDFSIKVNQRDLIPLTVKYIAERVSKLEWAIADHQKIQRLVDYCSSSATGLFLTVRKNEEIVGVALISGEELSWARKRYALIHIFFPADEMVAGIIAGEIEDWFNSRRNLLSMYYSFPDTQKDVETALERIGFEWEGTAFMLRRYRNGISKQDT